MIDGKLIGHYDKAHQFTCGGSQSGKSAAYSNHCCDWPGSLFHFTTKGNDASKLAHRRGPGNELCDGMGQKVVVIDPENLTLGVDQFKSTVNIIEGFLDPLDDKCFFKAFQLAVAFMPATKDEGEVSYFMHEGRGMLTDWMRHVASSPRCEGRRNILTVHKFIQQGDVYLHQRLIDEGKMPHDEKTGQPLFDPFDVLFDDMRENPHFNGALGVVADYWSRLRKAEKQELGVVGEIHAKLLWLEEAGWQRIFGGS